MKANLKMVKSLTVASALLLFAGCSQNADSKSAGGDALAGNIVGGKAVSDKFQKNNGVVALVLIREDGKEGICTGTLIAPELVLTAAHCLQGTAKLKGIVVAFTQDINVEVKSEQSRFGVRASVHPDFLDSAMSGAESWSDLALIKLDSPAPADFQAARLPKADNLTAPGTKLIQMGFGKTEAARDAAADTTGVLRQVSGIKVLEKTADGKEMKMDEATKGSCNGDSGGPAFLREKDGKLTLVGTDSRGTLEDSCIGVGIYTNVASHLDWIAKQSEVLMAPAPAEQPLDPATPSAPAPSAPSAPAPAAPAAD